MSKRVEFVNYTGKWPCLCHGAVTLKIDGKVVEFCKYRYDSKETGKPCLELESGGSCGFTDGYRDSYVRHGPWSIDLDPRYAELKDEILEVINDNVSDGCCGGCL